MAAEANSANQYPGCFKGKQVYVKSVDGEITRGTLTEIQDYHGKKLLVVEISVGIPRVLNFDHVTFIEEL